MKKFLIYTCIAISFFALSSFIEPAKAHADITGLLGPTADQNAANNNAATRDPQRSDYPNTPTGNQQYKDAMTAAMNESRGLQAASNSNPFTVVTNGLADLTKNLNPTTFYITIIKNTGALVLKGTGKILGIGGLLLNFTIEKTILGMNSAVKNLTAINEVWTIVRDVLNLTFIFFLLYIAISIILGIGGDAKKLVVNLIIAALLINFSLFMTKVIIDASNIMTIGIFNKIYADSGQLCGATKEVGFSDGIMQCLKLQTLYDVKKHDLADKAIPDFADVLKDGSAFALTTLMGAIFILVAAFVMFAAAILLVIRYVMLILLMILSPVAFAGLISPSLSTMSSKWWHELWNNILFAPIYMLLMLIAFRILPHLQVESIALKDTDSWSTVINSTGQNSMAIVLNFSIVIIFLVAALVISKSMGVRGAETMHKWGNSARKWGQGIVGRNTAGRLAKDVRQRYDQVEARLNNSKVFRGTAKLASFATLGATSAINKGIRSSIQTVESSKFGSTQNLADVEKENKERAKVIKGEQREMRNESAIQAAIKTPTGAAPEVLGRMTNKELEKIDVKDLTKPAVLQHLSASQIKHLTETSDLSDGDKEKVKQARLDLLNDSAKPGGSPVVVENILRGMQGSDLERLPQAMFTDELIDKLKPSHLKDMETAPGPIRAHIGARIRALGVGGHPAFGFINQRENRALWA